MRLSGISDRIWNIHLLFLKAYYSLKTRLIYATFFGKVGPRCRVMTPLSIKNPRFIFLEGHNQIRNGLRIEGVESWGTDRFQPKLVIERGTCLGQDCNIAFASEMVIGGDTTISFGVLITDVDHEHEAIGVPIEKQPLRVRPTRIGPGCFIGSGAKLLAGTILGKQCIVGANSVVRGTFPDRCVIAGLPARIVKRYNPESGSWVRTNAKGDFIDD